RNTKIGRLTVSDIYANNGQWGSRCFARLSPEQCERLHNASLEILESVGVRLYEPEAVELVRKAGARITDGNLAYIPAHLVEQAFSTLPKRVVLYNRNGEPVMPVEGYRSFYGPGSDCLNIVDHRTWEHRKPVLQDVVEGATVCDALDNIDFVMSMFLPSDVNQEIADRYQMEVMLNYTTKPIVFVTYDMSGCVDAVEMAEAVAGSPEALQEKPFVACYINVTTGLLHNEEALQKLLYLAAKGLPALYIPVVSAGMTGPMTMAGSMALVNAGVLTGLVLSQLKREGAPVIIPGWGGEGLDMRTLVEPYCGPDHRGLAEALAHYYDLPMFTLAGASDAKLVDQQAGIEAALTLMVDALAGGNIVHDLGYLESGLSGSLAQLVICDEIVDWIKHFMQEIEVNDETLALDVVREAGPDGHYVETEHTLRHFRERWYPRLFERDNYDGWVDKGSKSLAERAAQRVEEILATHQPERLPQDVAQAIHTIVERAEAQHAE
ncbi:MAG TPA: trimethylamine methyltransferase, partial [Anaerolineae bacterium]|nr:trimethylamine methyltransferase [Anaerolineae bacterium]